MQAITLNAISCTAWDLSSSQPNVLRVQTKIGRRTFSCVISSFKGLKLYSCATAAGMQTGVEKVSEDDTLCPFMNEAAMRVSDLKGDPPQIANAVAALFQDNANNAQLHLSNGSTAAFKPVCHV